MIKNNIRRESYLKFLNTWKNRDLIKVLSGVRRSGITKNYKKLEE